LPVETVEPSRLDPLDGREEERLAVGESVQTPVVVRQLIGRLLTTSKLQRDDQIVDRPEAFLVRLK